MKRELVRDLYRWVKGLPTLVRRVVSDVKSGPEGYSSCDGLDDGVPRFGTAWYAAEGCWLCPRMYLSTPAYLIRVALNGER